MSTLRFLSPFAVPAFPIAMALSLALHAAVLAIHFRMPEPVPPTRTEALQVVLVNAKSATKPHRARVLAQANLDGGGNTEQKLVATSPLPALDADEPRPELKAREARLRALEEEARRLMTQIEGRSVSTSAEAKPQREPAPNGAQGEDLISQSLAIARLQAQIERDYQAYQERPKRRFVGARAEEYRFAQYVEDWRQKVERIGNINYPEEARRNKIYGSLLLTVHIKSDGTVEKIEIDRPSGFRVLDEAAVRIVNLAAPFAPFPESIRKDTDILAITRTWTFTRQDQLTSQ